eukprot:TRINITY_DN66403_c3_g1_i1.p1 TRINITY_DN66403_c3_g1~~TRINITY_DN66403_c3_g1_i1.p1  ORF type:complete len:107 (-),score=2.90 TRINITY_DN66403_c3_g1_i1:641-961(-)
MPRASPQKKSGVVDLDMYSPENLDCRTLGLTQAWVLGKADPAEGLSFQMHLDRTRRAHPNFLLTGCMLSEYKVQTNQPPTCTACWFGFTVGTATGVPRMGNPLVYS